MAPSRRRGAAEAVTAGCVEAAPAAGLTGIVFPPAAAVTPVPAGALAAWETVVDECVPWLVVSCTGLIEACTGLVTPACGSPADPLVCAGWTEIGACVEPGCWAVVWLATPTVTVGVVTATGPLTGPCVVRVTVDVVRVDAGDDRVLVVGAGVVSVLITPLEPESELTWDGQLLPGAGTIVPCLDSSDGSSLAVARTGT